MVLLILPKVFILFDFYFYYYYDENFLCGLLSTIDLVHVGDFAIFQFCCSIHVWWLCFLFLHLLIFQNVTFKIEIVTNLREVLFLHVMFNLKSNTYHPYKEAKWLSHLINTSLTTPTPTPNPTQQTHTSKNSLKKSENNCLRILQK